MCFADVGLHFGKFKVLCYRRSVSGYWDRAIHCMLTAILDFNKIHNGTGQSSDYQWRRSGHY